MLESFNKYLHIKILLYFSEIVAIHLACDALYQRFAKKNDSVIT